MSRLWIEGFETKDMGAADAGSLYGTYIAAATYGFPYGSWCNLMQTSGVLKKGISAISEIYVSFKIRLGISVATTSPIGMKLMNGANSILSVGFEGTTPNLVLKAYIGNTLLATGTANYANNTVYLVEVHYKLDDSAGVCEVRVNQAADDINFSGNTKPGLDTTFDTFYVGVEATAKGIYAGGAYGTYYDDIVLESAAWVGNTGIQAIYPTGAGNLTEWTPSAGNNWQTVDEIAPSDTDYNAVNAINKTDSFACSDLSGSILSVKALQAQMRCGYDGTPTPTKVKIACRTSSTYYYGSDITVPLSFAPYLKLWETNPAGGAWDDTAINGIELGYESVA